MASKKRGMEAVIAKTGKRRMMARRKGPPGVAIMIAMGPPKGAMKGERKDESPSMKEELDASKGEGMSKAKKIAALEEKIGYLKAELALLKADESDMDESDMEEEDEMEDEED